MKPSRPPLRVSLSVRSLLVPAWIATLVEQVHASPRFDVQLYVDEAAPPIRWPWAYRAYEWADARVFGERLAAVVPLPLAGTQPRSLADLGEFLEARYRCHGVTDQVMFGDCRPVHRCAAVAGKRLAVTTSMAATARYVSARILHHLSTIRIWCTHPDALPGLL